MRYNGWLKHLLPIIANLEAFVYITSWSFMKLMHLLLLILVLVLGLLVKQTWFNDGNGHKKLDDLQISLEELKIQNQKLIDQNNDIRQTINGIKHNYSAREELARKHLGLIKEDETFFHVISSEDNNTDRASD